METAFWDGDYIQDKKGIFYHVLGYNNNLNFINAVSLYIPDSTGPYFDKNGLRYKKQCNDLITRVPVDSIILHLKPYLFPDKAALPGPWGDFLKFMVGNGISLMNIGVCGSKLLGLTKQQPSIRDDIDFIIYGDKNRLKLKRSLGQNEKFYLGERLFDDYYLELIEKYRTRHSLEITNFPVIFKNRWSSIRVGKTIITIRFCLKQREVKEFMNYSPIYNGPVVNIEGVVIKDSYVDYMPRVFVVNTQGNKKFMVYTHYWAFQSCVKQGQEVRVNGVQFQPNKVEISSYDHGIYIL